MIEPAFDTSYCLVNAQELFRAKEPEIPWCLQLEEKWLAQFPRTLNETESLSVCPCVWNGKSSCGSGLYKWLPDKLCCEVLFN